VERAIELFRAGLPVVMVDDDDRENEGDVCIPAANITAEQVNFMAVHARGLICLTLPPAQVARLGLAQMAPDGGEEYGTAFTVSIEAAEGVTTGISAADRAHTMRVASAPGATPADIVQPGHVFPLRARPGGVLERQGHTEGTVDLARLAGIEPAVAICEVMNADGTMARRDDLEVFCAEHGLALVTIADLVAYREAHPELIAEPLVAPVEDVVVAERGAAASIPTRHGEFTAVGYTARDGSEHVALVYGDVEGAEDVLVRVHSSCVTGDAFGSLRCDCGAQLDGALARVAAAGRGVVVYLSQEGRGIGLVNKLRAYELQQAGRDTVDANVELGFPADAREYSVAAHALHDLGVRSVRLMTNNPAKIDGLREHGIDVVGRAPLEVGACDHNLAYLEAKRDRMGHMVQEHLRSSAGRRARRLARQTYAGDINLLR
jgi:3,4-dihydroxy 2-butanone 4-phosphate synthase/GTP cyclohydrolase II